MLTLLKRIFTSIYFFPVLSLLVLVYFSETANAQAECSGGHTHTQATDPTTVIAPGGDTGDGSKIVDVTGSPPPPSTFDTDSGCYSHPLFDPTLANWTDNGDGTWSFPMVYSSDDLETYEEQAYQEYLAQNNEPLTICDDLTCYTDENGDTNLTYYIPVHHDTTGMRCSIPSPSDVSSVSCNEISDQWKQCQIYDNRGGFTVLETKSWSGQVFGKAYYGSNRSPTLCTTEPVSDACPNNLNFCDSAQHVDFYTALSYLRSPIDFRSDNPESMTDLIDDINRYIINDFMSSGGNYDPIPDEDDDSNPVDPDPGTDDGGDGSGDDSTDDGSSGGGSEDDGTGDGSGDGTDDGTGDGTDDGSDTGTDDGNSNTGGDNGDGTEEEGLDEGCYQIGGDVVCRHDGQGDMSVISSAMQNAWNAKRHEFQQLAGYQFISSFSIPEVEAGSCPSFNYSFLSVFGLEEGQMELTIPCWVYDYLRIIWLALASFTAFRIIFSRGGD